MPTITEASSPYYPPPYSLPTLPHHIHTGLILIGSLALLSILSTSSLLIYLTYDYFIARRRQHNQRNNSATSIPGSSGKSRHVNTTQCTTLIANLLTADLLQSLALVISLHWESLNGIFSPSPACWMQAGLLHIGDTASGGFVLAIAGQTMWAVVRGRRIERKWFRSVVVGIWLSVLVLTVSGPAKYGKVFFTRAGNWCWISQDYQSERLWLHYFWIFLDEFGTLTIYVALIVYLLRRMSFFSRHIPASLPTHQQPEEPTTTTTNKLSLQRTYSSTIPTRASMRISKATRTMLLYPSVYVILTLPLATLRMISMSGGHPSDTSLLVAGAMLTSCGWVDSMVYALTRHILIKGERKSSRRQRRGTEDPTFHNPEDGFSRRRTTSDVPGMSKETLASFSGPDSVEGVEMTEHLADLPSPFTHPMMFAQRVRERKREESYFDFFAGSGGSGSGGRSNNDADNHETRESTPTILQHPPATATLKPPSIARKESYVQSLGGIRKDTTVEILYSAKEDGREQSVEEGEYEVESRDFAETDDFDDDDDDDDDDDNNKINGSKTKTKTKTRYSGEEWRAQHPWAGQ